MSSTPSRWGRFFRRILLGCCLAGGTVADCVRAAAPDWLNAALAEDPPQWNSRASSVELLDYGEVNYLPGGKLRKTYRRVVKLRRENGFAEVNTRMYYASNTARVLQARAWIVSPDGRATRAFGRRDFLDAVAQFNQYSWDYGRVVRFNREQDVDVGGALAWEYEVEDETGILDSSWHFAPRIPTVRRVLVAAPVPGGRLVSFSSSSRIPAPAAGPRQGSLRWEMLRAEPVPQEISGGFFPNPMRLSVRCLEAGELSARMQTWGQFAAVASDIMEPQVVADAAVVARANALVQGKSGRLERILAIADYAQRKIAYLSVQVERDSLVGFRPHLPAAVIRSGFGDCKDKATLVAALLRAIGEKGYVVLVNATNPREVEPGWPGQYFNHAIAAIAAGPDAPADWPLVDGGPLGRLVLFDPTNPAALLGVLPENDQHGFGLIVSRGTSGLIALPAETPEQSSLTSRLDGTLTTTGDLNAEVTETIAGAAGAAEHYACAFLGREKFTNLLETRLHGFLPLVSGLTWKEDWRPEGSRCRLTYKFKADQPGGRLGENMILILPPWLTQDPALAAWEQGLEGSYWVNPRSVRLEMRLRLPEGFRPDELPSAWHQDLDWIVSDLTYRLEGALLVSEMRLRQSPGFIDRQKYEALRALHQQLDGAMRRPVIVRKGV